LVEVGVEIVKRVIFVLGKMALDCARNFVPRLAGTQGIGVSLYLRRIRMVKIITGSNLRSVDTAYGVRRTLRVGEK
jgi:hypothetical protein